MTTTNVAISWTLLIMAGFFMFLAIFVANGSVERLMLLMASIIFDCIAFGMFLQQLIGRKR
jgi:hypothetical protein